MRTFYLKSRARRNVFYHGSMRSIKERRFTNRRFLWIGGL